MLRILSIILSLAVASSLAISCPNVALFQNLDLSKYAGQWYEVERFPFFQEDGLRCVGAEYTPTGEPLTVKVNNTGIQIKDGKLSSVIGRAVANAQEPSKITVEFFDGIARGPYWVVDTDYRYSLVYSCTNFLGIYNLEYAWILSRQRNLKSSIIETLKAKLRSFNIDSSKFLVTDQSNC